MSEVSSQTLHLVARELATELNDARAALETFGEQQESIELLQKCRDRLHAVHGALRVAEVYGAALLAEEMEQGATYLIENFSEKRHLAEGLDALMRAMVQLPTYLERVLSGGRDMALVLLPLLNDLRAVRGHPLLSEGTLLLLNLTSDQQASPPPTGTGDSTAMSVSQLSRKLRTRFQLGLLGWIKGERVEHNLELLGRVAERLEQVATTQPLFQLWWVVGALLEGLRDGGLDSSASAKRLLGQADRELKRLYTLGEARYAEDPPVELLNNLLYYVARTKSAGPRVAAVRASFRLNELLPVDQHVEQARESLSAPSVKLMKTVAAAIKEDLARVKDALDIFVRKGGTHSEELASQLELLKKIADTLGVLGLGELRDKVQIETGHLQGIVEQRTPANEGMLLNMAATLIKVEDSLDEQLVGLIVPSSESAEQGAAPPQAEDTEFRQVTEAVLRECIVNMARVKEAVALSVEKPREAQQTDQIPQLMRGITAGLLMLGKTRAVEIAEGIDRALDSYLHTAGSTLAPEAVDRLADAIVAVEYYMETIQSGRTDPWYMLDNADGCLKYLAECDLVPRVAEPAISDHARTIVLDASAQTTGATTTHDRTVLLDTTTAAPSVTPKGKVVTTADPEFVELFIEEAKDEITKLQRLFPLWDENPQDIDALTHVRRSFHTLKGSGRMVGAQLIGDFAWSIENLLNRVINKTLDRTPDMMVLLREAVAAVPALVEQLETGRPIEIDVNGLMARANDMSGQHPTPPAGTPRMTRDSTPKSVPPPARPAPRASDTSARVVALNATGTSRTVVALDSPLASSAATNRVRALKPASEPAMDPTLAEIFTKETAGHLATIRYFMANAEQNIAPYPVTEDLHRACHTLSGTAKTTGLKPAIRVAEPLNHYIRKLYDNSAGLPGIGLEALRDAVSAIESVVANLGENTGYFMRHDALIGRIQRLDHALDSELARLAETMDVGPGVQQPDPLEVTQSVEDALATAVRADDSMGNDDSDVFEIEPTDANALEAFELNERSAPVAQVESDSSPTVEPPVLSFRPQASGESTVIKALSFDDLDDISELPGSLDHLEQTVRADEAVAASEDAIVVEEIELSAGDDLGVLLDPADTGTHIEIRDLDTLNSRFGNIESIEMHGESAIGEEDELRPASDSTTSISALDLDNLEHVEIIEELPASQIISETPSWSPPQQTPPVAVAPMVVPVAMPAVAQAAVEEVTTIDADFDPEVAAIFSEEASELLESADASLAAWTRDRANAALIFELKRALHTLKGGARMAGISAMGDLSHEFESFMLSVEAGTAPQTPEVFSALQESLDQLHRMRDEVNLGKPCRSARGLIQRIQAFTRGETSPPPIAEPVAATPQPAPASFVPASTVSAPVEIVADHSGDTDMVPTLTETFEHDDEVAVEFKAEELEPPPEIVEPPVLIDEHRPRAPVSIDLVDEIEEVEAPAAVPDAPVLPGREQAAQERQEFARVDADLLDNLLNNAGEVSIFRSRMEQQVGSIEFNLTELNGTVSRLKEQLRKLELETEAQVLHRHPEDSRGREDFDPLELDRYSNIQQLSRALAESVSDVGSIQGLLENLTREAQNLLLQQSRVVTELQNGLMRTRMVPFQRHVQRLTRLVRQVATDTGKRADLVVVGASGELDRQVLERMMPPFEHMLRNSVVHGIETPAERSAAGKNESGTITVGLHREGSEMIIVLEDDGRGIDVKAVRQRARERGLIQAGQELTDEEALQLVLEPGFSTASSVTQHAGRGVGMDVVVNEIKKLGGALFTESTAGKGVKFTIRLPFTLAITQALIVRVGIEQYALPLPTVEGVARIPRSDVERYLGEETPTFTYGGQVYRLQHLGAFIGGGPSLLPDADVAVPLILIRAGEHSVALVTDELIGSREMVVKSVGPQVASIRGIAGATILGDGRIVIILDMGALVRSEWRTSRTQLDTQVTQDRRTFALVVDDSITVRRVTQRFLERSGMKVMTAKDGVDALSVLQEHVPDVILLDIEMPRMDGYEFATQVRGDQRFADIPIIMITSRVGEKHRARAIEIGVNDYLGKPYQENELLDAIEPLVEARRRKAS
jgi:chemosensory pili system protein ChpA (sensor histidine kinase/response regulator)